MSTLDALIQGYKRFKSQYANNGIYWTQTQVQRGQQPPCMVVACCDSRVDPALLLQCKPGDLFVLRNIANIIPPYENDGAHHGASSALEFGICYLNVQHLILLGHSECGGIATYLQQAKLPQDDFISQWLDLITIKEKHHDVDTCAKASLFNSYHNCWTFPWIKQRLQDNKLSIHLWFLDIKTGIISTYHPESKEFTALDT